MTQIKRALRFLRNLWRLRGTLLIVDIGLSRHNLRAAWIQSEPGWFEKRFSEPLFDSDEEADAFLASLDEQRGYRDFNCPECGHIFGHEPGCRP